jgi:hypothetical protein
MEVEEEQRRCDVQGSQHQGPYMQTALPCKKTIHQGWRRITLTDELDRIKKLYDDLRQRDSVTDVSH